MHIQPGIAVFQTVGIYLISRFPGTFEIIEGRLISGIVFRRLGFGNADSSFLIGSLGIHEVISARMADINTGASLFHQFIKRGQDRPFRRDFPGSLYDRIGREAVCFEFHGVAFRFDAADFFAGSFPVRKMNHHGALLIDFFALCIFEVDLDIHRRKDFNLFAVRTDNLDIEDPCICKGTRFQSEGLSRLFKIGFVFPCGIFRFPALQDFTHFKFCVIRNSRIFSEGHGNGAGFPFLCQEVFDNLRIGNEDFKHIPVLHCDGQSFFRRKRLQTDQHPVRSGNTHRVEFALLLFGEITAVFAFDPKTFSDFSDRRIFFCLINTEKLRCGE